uniref:Ribosomal protein L30 ferredoxin-like fold domain-containing protein n=2 Tax=Aegilops tauschii subsp. strangulata TaxID=200361 RepID=A0A452Y8X3_AEGTS
QEEEGQRGVGHQEPGAQGGQDAAPPPRRQVRHQAPRGLRQGVPQQGARLPADADAPQGPESAPRRGHRRQASLRHPHPRALLTCTRKIGKILARLQLKKVLTGVFLKATEANLKRLATVGPFVTYGFPNLKNVKELIYKKGRGYFDKEPFPLTSNDLIEKRQEEEKTAINTHVLNKNVVLASLLRQCERLIKMRKFNLIFVKVQ